VPAAAQIGNGRVHALVSILADLAEEPPLKAAKARPSTVVDVHVEVVGTEVVRKKEVSVAVPIDVSRAHCQRPAR
jgi:hypothetical protein